MRHKAPRSLKSRALQLLAQREQSRVELRRKLLAHAVAESLAHSLAAHSLAESSDGVTPGDSALGAGSGLDASCPPEAAIGRGTANGLPAVDDVEARGDAATRVDAVLLWLEAHGFLSDERFAESRVNARVGRYGNLRIQHELKQHGVVLDADAAERLCDSETLRAWAVWERRFGTRPVTPADMARQTRFLGLRGFSGETIATVMRQARALPVEAGANPAGD